MTFTHWRLGSVYCWKPLTTDIGAVGDGKEIPVWCFWDVRMEPPHMKPSLNWLGNGVLTWNLTRMGAYVDGLKFAGGPWYFGFQISNESGVPRKGSLLMIYISDDRIVLSFRRKTTPRINQSRPPAWCLRLHGMQECQLAQLPKRLNRNHKSRLRLILADLNDRVAGLSMSSRNQMSSQWWISICRNAKTSGSFSMHIRNAPKIHAMSQNLDIPELTITILVFQ